MIKIKKGKITVESNTPRIPGLNRAARRDMAYGHPVRRLLFKINELHKDMEGAGIKYPSMPKFKNRKVLSGYMSKLVELARK